MNQTFANVNDKIFKLVYQEFNFCHQTSAFFNANFKKQINCKQICWEDPMMANFLQFQI